MIIYFCLIIYGDSYFGGQDLFGLGIILKIISMIIIHTIYVFAFSIYKSYKLNKDEKST